MSEETAIKEVVKNASELFTPTMISNLYTMTASAKKDARQALPASPRIPQADVRMLRARLILEEAFETVKGLGVEIACDVPIISSLKDLSLHIRPEENGGIVPNLEDIIDGACDTIYVATGTLAACGVPDVPHLLAVSKANDEKFPNGVATVDEFGKFVKPSGWVAPNHARTSASLPDCLRAAGGLAGVGNALVESVR